MSVFNNEKIDETKQPLFFGKQVNIARYDRQKYPIFEKLTEKQRLIALEMLKISSLLMLMNNISSLAT